MKAIMTYARFVREKYTYIILTTLVIAVVVGLFTPSPGVYIRQFNTPLIIIMIAAMGFTITFKSLGTAVKDWRGFSLGLVLNFLFAPFLCWLLALLLLSGHSDLATGLILIGVVPCAGMALVWAGLLKGDVPLATVINAATMILAPFLIPLLMSLFAGTFVTVNTWGMFLQLIYTVLLPVLGGIALREVIEIETNVQKYLPVMPAISATMAVLLMFMAINTNIPPIMKNIRLIAPLVASTILIFPILFLVAYLVSLKLFPKGKNIAITYSSGMKNLPIAIGIAAMSFKGLEMLPVAVGFAFQMLTAVTFYQLFRRATTEKSKQ
ncbi:MAG: arsenic resistance protein [Thermodesulfobacteriota bacterium]